MRRAFRRFSKWRIAVALGLAVVVALGIVSWHRTSQVERIAAVRSPASGEYETASMARIQRQSALFVGDDFTVGRGAGMDEIDYPYAYVVCDWLALNCNVDAQSGTGFVNDGRNYSPENSRLVDRLVRDRTVYQADVVIVDAGRNDNDLGPEEYGQAMEEFVREVVRFWPTARLVVIAPAAFSADPYPGYAERVSVIGQIAHSYGGVLIDPVAQGWYAEIGESEIQASDNTLPNQAGHYLIAKKLAESLERDGALIPRGAT